MFEKESEYYAFDEVKHKQEWYIKHPERSIDDDYEDIKKHWQKGAEFGYNNAKEWYYVKDKLPETKYDIVSVTVAYLNAFENPCKMDCYYDGKDFIYWDNGENVGRKHVDIFGTVYAWKYRDNFIPELPKESE